MEDSVEPAGVVDGLAVPDNLLNIAALAVVRPRGLVLRDAVLVCRRGGKDENEGERRARNESQEVRVVQGQNIVEGERT